MDNNIIWLDSTDYPDILSEAGNGFSVDVLAYSAQSKTHTVAWFDFKLMKWTFLTNEDFTDFKWRYFVDNLDTYTMQDIEFIKRKDADITTIKDCLNMVQLTDGTRYSIAQFEGVDYCVIQRGVNYGYTELIPHFYKQMKIRRIFKHEGSGQYVGSCVIVWAQTLDKAKFLISEKLNEIGLKNEVLNVKEVNLNKGAYIYVDNGDY